MTQLQKIRTEKGLSQVALASLSGVSSVTIYLIERGVTKRPRLETVLKLASALEVESGELIKDKALG